MIAFVFVVLMQPIGGTIQSEAFDYSSAGVCEEKRAAVFEYLLADVRVVEFYIGACQRITLVTKT